METAHLLRLLGMVSALQQLRCWDIDVPAAVTAVEGSCVVVPCHTQPHSQVNWYKYHKSLYPVVYSGLEPHKVEPQFKGRTSVLGSAGEGSCTLKIDDVRISDNNLKVYVWINPQSIGIHYFHRQTVTIFVKENTPVISVQSQILEGDIFQASCIMEHSCPFSPPSIHWNENPFLKNLTLLNFSTEAQGFWLYRETLQGTATHEMHLSKISCSAQFSTFTTESQHVTLNILYKPISVKLLLEEKVLMEGGCIAAECAADSNPRPHVYSWIRRNMGINSRINSTKRIMSFCNITRNTSLSCEAHNDIGEQQSDWKDLQVKYPPVILPESSCSLMGDVLMCLCLAEASPNASLSWNIDGNQTFRSLSTTISTVQTNVVSEEILVKSQNNVSCTAWNQFGSDTKQLFISTSSKTSSWMIWLSSLIPVGIILFLGCLVFTQRKYFNRSQDSHSNLNPEDRLSPIYANVSVKEMKRLKRHQNIIHNREGESLPMAQAGDSNMDIYANCWLQNKF